MVEPKGEGELLNAKAAVSFSIAGIAVAAWLTTILGVGSPMEMPTIPVKLVALVLFTLSWTIGMLAMMFPTTIPMIMMFFHVGRSASKEVREGGGPTPTKAFVFATSYLGVWVSLGLVIYIAVALLFSALPFDVITHITSAAGIGISLSIVGLYQVSPMKGECLRRCHPTSFFYRYYRGGIIGSVKMGWHYAEYCVGCCWVMMLFLLIVGSMGTIWMAILAAIILSERVMTTTLWPSRVIGVGFLLSGIFLIFTG